MTPLGVAEAAAYKTLREPDGLLPTTMRELKGAIEQVETEVNGYIRTPPQDRRYWRMWEETKKAMNDALARAILMKGDVVRSTILSRSIH